jgi:MYXO-CTERM domain-containing protein
MQGEIVIQGVESDIPAPGLLAGLAVLGLAALAPRREG